MSKPSSMKKMSCPSSGIDLGPRKSYGINLNLWGCVTLVRKRNNAQLEMEEEPPLRDREREITMMDCFYIHETYKKKKSLCSLNTQKRQKKVSASIQGNTRGLKIIL